MASRSFARPLALLAASLPLLAVAADAALAIEANGFTHARGHAVARIYAAGDDVMGEPRWSARAPIENGQAQLTCDLPAGAYAVVVYHDENDNGRLDHNVLGFPAEPLGFSNGFRLSLTSGLPAFAKLKFALPPAGTTIQIQVH